MSLFKAVDLIEELDKIRASQAENALMAEVDTILAKHAQSDLQTQARLQGDALPREAGALDIEHMETARIYSEAAIEKLCTHFRLRFLETRMFKGDVPYEALVQMREFEAKVGAPVGYKIVAPANLFMLQDSKKDPLLMADLGNGQYYLIHKWGTDLEWYRLVLNFPFRSMSSMAISSMVIAFLLTLVIPFEEMTGSMESTQVSLVAARFFLFSVMSGLLFTVALIAGITASKDFSENVWDSKFFN